MLSVSRAHPDRVSGACPELAMGYPFLQDLRAASSPAEPLSSRLWQAWRAGGAPAWPAPPLPSPILTSSGLVLVCVSLLAESQSVHGRERLGKILSDARQGNVEGWSHCLPPHPCLRAPEDEGSCMIHLLVPTNLSPRQPSAPALRACPPLAQLHAQPWQPAQQMQLLLQPTCRTAWWPCCAAAHHRSDAGPAVGTGLMAADERKKLIGTGAVQGLRAAEGEGGAAGGEHGRGGACRAACGFTPACRCECGAPDAHPKWFHSCS